MPTTNKARPEKDDIWYRVESGSSYGPNGSLTVLEFEVLRVTPKGVWLNGSKHYDVREFFVLLEGKKKRAYASLAEALYSFIRRKERQLIHLDAQVNRASKSRDWAEICLKNLQAGNPVSFTASPIALDFLKDSP